MNFGNLRKNIFNFLSKFRLVVLAVVLIAVAGTVLLFVKQPNEANAWVLLGLKKNIVSVDLPADVWSGPATPPGGGNPAHWHGVVKGKDFPQTYGVFIDNPMTMCPYQWVTNLSNGTSCTNASWTNSDWQRWHYRSGTYSPSSNSGSVGGSPTGCGPTNSDPCAGTPWSYTVFNWNEPAGTGFGQIDKNNFVKIQCPTASALGSTAPQLISIQATMIAWLGYAFGGTGTGATTSDPGWVEVDISGGSNNGVRLPYWQNTDPNEQFTYDNKVYHTYAPYYYPNMDGPIVNNTYPGSIIGVDVQLPITMYSGVSGGASAAQAANFKFNGAKLFDCFAWDGDGHNQYPDGTAGTDTSLHDESKAWAISGLQVKICDKGSSQHMMVMSGANVVLTPKYEHSAAVNQYLNVGQQLSDVITISATVTGGSNLNGNSWVYWQNGGNGSWNGGTPIDAIFTVRVYGPFQTPVVDLGDTMDSAMLAGNLFAQRDFSATYKGDYTITFPDTITKPGYYYFSTTFERSRNVYGATNQDYRNGQWVNNGVSQRYKYATSQTVMGSVNGGLSTPDILQGYASSGNNLPSLINENCDAVWTVVENPNCERSVVRFQPKATSNGTTLVTRNADDTIVTNDEDQHARDTVRVFAASG